MKRIYLVLSLVVGAPVAAHAQGAPDEPKLLLGASFGLSPIGTGHAEIMDMKISSDTDTAFAITGMLEYRATPLVSIALAPSYILNAKGKDDTTSATALDLAVRLMVGSDVGSTARLYGFVAPGYSFLFPPSTPPVDFGTPSGFMFGFGGGVGIHVAPKLMLTGELGYQLRFTSGSVNNVDFSLGFNYLTFAAGLAVALD